MFQTRQKAIIAIVVIALLAVPLSDILGRTIVNTAIHSELILRTVMKIEVRKKVRENIDEWKNKIVVGWWLNLLKDWEDREIEALQAASEFIDAEISNEKLYIHILEYPAWGLGWCVTRYRFELRWEDDRVATFRITLSGEDRFDVTLNDESQFIDTLTEKAK